MESVPGAKPWREALRQRLAECQKQNGAAITAPPPVGDNYQTNRSIAHMEFKLDNTDEGWVLTVGDTKWVYGRSLKNALRKVESLAEDEAKTAAAAKGGLR